jgi:hypothetical protein
MFGGQFSDSERKTGQIFHPYHLKNRIPLSESESENELQKKKNSNKV